MWFIQYSIVQVFSVVWSRLSIARDETDSRHDRYVYNLMVKILDVLRGASGEGVGHPTPFITEID